MSQATSEAYEDFFLEIFAISLPWDIYGDHCHVDMFCEVLADIKIKQISNNLQSFGE